MKEHTSFFLIRGSERTSETVSFEVLPGKSQDGYCNDATPAVMHDTLDELQLLSHSVVSMIAYSMNAEDLSDMYIGAAKRLRTCGYFKENFVIPFFFV